MDERDLRAARRAGLGQPQLKRALDDRGPRIPRGGSIGQVVTKTSLADDLVSWGAGGGGSGGGGNTVLSGAGVPTGGTGVDGDFYIDVSANTIYGPKAAGAWGSPTSLVGPAGPQGIQGLQGLQGLQGPAGSQGPQGATGLQGATGPQGPAGTTGPQGPQGPTGDTGATGATGAQGPAGATGPQGPAGVGVPVGGTANQVLAKIDSTDYNTQWVTPSGGSSNTVHASRLRADTALSTTPVTVASVVFPSAGTYNVSFTLRVVAPSTVLATFNDAAITELMGSWRRDKLGYTVDIGRTYSKPTLFASYGLGTGEMHSITFDGHVIVSAGVTVPLQVAVSAGTGTAAAGTNLTVTLESANVTPFGPVNYIQLTSGVGFAGSVLTSSAAGQWTRDGVSIGGATGSTYTVVVADEGAEIKCGNSNPFQLWTPKHLPDVYKTDGTNFGVWIDPSDAASVTLSGARAISVVNKFGGPAMQHTVPAEAPTYTAGGLFFDIGFKLLSASNVVSKHFAAVTTHATGLTASFTGYSYTLWHCTAFSGDAIRGSNAFTSFDAGSTYTAGDVWRNAVQTKCVHPINKTLLEVSLIGAAGVWGVQPISGIVSWYGSVFELLALAKHPGMSIRTKIQGYMLHKAGQSANMPVDHPYYNAPPRIS